jgi:hypothetical protein
MTDETLGEGLTPNQVAWLHDRAVATRTKWLKHAASHKMTEAEVEEQRKSWVRGMTTGCEHGVLDFETCPQCRGHQQQRETT